jgi:integrase
MHQRPGKASSPNERNVRLRELAIFARYLQAEDTNHALIPRDVYARFKRHRRPPHIYSDQDIRRILAAAGELKPMGDTYRTLFGLLAATGMRIQEALSLQLLDVATTGLTVRNTKFRKSRWLPLDPTVTAELSAYRSRWRATAASDDPLFVGRSGSGLLYGSVDVTFNRIIDELGLTKLPEPGRRRSPRLHDLRHTFAVRTLEDCPDGSAAINKHTLALSTYLGHTSVAGTYWYLQVTPHLMVGIADACETWLARGAR